MAQTIEILDRDDIGDAVQHLLENSEIVSDAVRVYVEDQELVTKDDVDRQIDDALDNRNLLDEDDVERIIRDQNLAHEDDILSESDIDDIVERKLSESGDDGLERRLDEMERRLDRLYQKTDAQQGRFTMIIGALRDLLTALAGS